MNSWLLGALAVIAVGVITFLRERRSPFPITRSLSDPEPFARLLVIEIRKYNGKAVERAWSDSAIYRMLKDDIDRSRQMFLKRFPESEKAFYAAPVAVLGRGEDRLGSDYPYRKDFAETHTVGSADPDSGGR